MNEQLMQERRAPQHPEQQRRPRLNKPRPAFRLRLKEK